jgi:hypothetical protein
MDVQKFIQRWQTSTLQERQAAQSHFIELCRLIGHPTPTEADPKGKFFTFEEGVRRLTGGRGRADVWKRGHFIWEYKSKGEDLERAYQQLLSYRGALGNPPLLVVCNFEEYRIYPQFVNLPGTPITFKNEELVKTDKLDFLRWLFNNPDEFRRYIEAQLGYRAAVTERRAAEFAAIADILRTRYEPMRVARFLARLAFALFVEDIGLLPRLAPDLTIFRFLARSAQKFPQSFSEQLQHLFNAMNGQRKEFMLQPVPYFNGSVFAPEPDEGRSPEVLDLSPFNQTDIFLKIEEASEANWRYVNPTIFGTLFERALDPSKRAQLGAHYTSESDIRLIVEPVLMQPLYDLWDRTRKQAEPLLQLLSDSSATPAQISHARSQLLTLHDTFMERLAHTTVLDPACGSGNFLYVALRAMKDLEQRARDLFAPLGLEFKDVVTPRQFYGLEKEPFAARLAQIVVWIGYLQWRYDHEGSLVTEYRVPTDPRWLGSPILRDRDNLNDLHEPRRIQLNDAILRYDPEGKPYAPDWQSVDVIISNPPFLGNKRMLRELGDAYVNDLRRVYAESVSGGADLVCYWFEQARRHLEQGKVKRVGMLATNSIRGGANRKVLERIKQTGDIFMAWSDREWSLDGAAVRISVIGFDNGSEKRRRLDGKPVAAITADLTASVDITVAKRLKENLRIAFQGVIKSGSFDIPDELAQELLKRVNPSGRSNAEVVRRWRNGLDITRRPRNMWIVDFGVNMPLEQARLYEAPFEYVERVVRPERTKIGTLKAREHWWLYESPRPEMRQALHGLRRFLCTPRVSKHRIFVWLEPDILPDSATVAFAREDDYFFGVLHSYLHEVWALRMGTSLEDRPRYTPTTTFETFPMPYPPGTEPKESAEYGAIAAAAAELHRVREAWLNPPEVLESALSAEGAERFLKDRTLTNLYNAVEAYRTGKSEVRIPSVAREIAPQIAALHDALDRAVLAAYGWQDLADQLRTEAGREEILARLLAENLRRAADDQGQAVAAQPDEPSDEPEESLEP